MSSAAAGKATAAPQLPLACVPRRLDMTSALRWLLRTGDSTAACAGGRRRRRRALADSACSTVRMPGGSSRLLRAVPWGRHYTGQQRARYHRHRLAVARFDCCFGIGGT